MHVICEKNQSIALLRRVGFANWWADINNRRLMLMDSCFSYSFQVDVNMSTVLYKYVC